MSHFSCQTGRRVINYIPLLRDGWLHTQQQPGSCLRMGPIDQKCVARIDSCVIRPTLGRHYYLTFTCSIVLRLAFCRGRRYFRPPINPARLSDGWRSAFGSTQRQSFRRCLSEIDIPTTGGYFSLHRQSVGLRCPAGCVPTFWQALSLAARNLARLHLVFASCPQSGRGMPCALPRPRRYQPACLFSYSTNVLVCVCECVIERALFVNMADQIYVPARELIWHRS